MVAVDQPVVEVETAKAVVEVPVPFAGPVAALHGEPGDVVAVGAPLVTVDTADRLAEPGVVTPPAGPDRAAEPATSWSATARPAGAAAVTGPARSPAAIPAPALAPRPHRGAGRHRRRGRAQRPAGRGLAAGPAAGPEAGSTWPTSAAPARRADHPRRRRRGIAPAGRPAAGPRTGGAGRRTPGSPRIPLRGRASPSRTSSPGHGARSPRRPSGWTPTPPSCSALRAALNADDAAPKISLLALLARFTCRAAPVPRAQRHGSTATRSC